MATPLSHAFQTNPRGFRRDPQAPCVSLPAGACDTHTHMHIVGPFAQYPLCEASTLCPPEATLASYQATLEAVEFNRHVIIQSSFFAKDNVGALASAAAVGAQACAVVVVVDANIDAATLQSMHACGARGVRTQHVVAGGATHTVGGLLCDRNNPAMDDKQPVSERTFEPVRAPARVLQVIYEIALSANGLSLARLVTQTGLPKTSVLNLLRSLEASNYVLNIGGNYRLGPEALKVAAAVTTKERFLPAAQPVLQALYRETGETVQLSVLASDEPAAESVEVIETRKPIRLSFPTGLRRPLYCSSIGKLLLAHQEDAWIEKYLANTRLVPYTPQTMTDPALLRVELKRIRETGLSVSHQGMFEDSSGVSAAIWNGHGQMVGGVSIVAPTYRMMRDEARIQQLVLQAAREISKQLGHEGNYCTRSFENSRLDSELVCAERCVKQLGRS